ncbi:MAG TPA: flagellar export protein FliJ [Treponema sp.]|nr:flagellar export protein FliJ [Treponema sp.]
MKRFSFRLEKLLNFRLFREREAEINLGKAISARDALQLELDDIALKRVRTSGERRSQMPLNELLAIEHYITRLDDTKEKLIEKLVMANIEVEKVREKYISATKNRRVLSKLREKKTTEWKKYVLEEEAAILDDISNFRNRNGSL